MGMCPHWIQQTMLERKENKHGYVCSMCCNLLHTLESSLEFLRIMGFGSQVDVSSKIESLYSPFPSLFAQFFLFFFF